MVSANWRASLSKAAGRACSKRSGMLADFTFTRLPGVELDLAEASACSSRGRRGTSRRRQRGQTRILSDRLFIIGASPCSRSRLISAFPLWLKCGVPSCACCYRCSSCSGWKQAIGCGCPGALGLQALSSLIVGAAQLALVDGACSAVFGPPVHLFVSSQYQSLLATR